jgi:Leucine-rich repeat (LRR) protein
MDILDLSENNVKKIFENTIKGVFSKLNLDDNLISSFESNSFGYMPNIIEIYFSKNLIKKLDFHYAFKFQISTLEFIDFSHNQIDFIDGFNFFSKFPNLESLDLAFNQFHSLSNSYFLNLFRLKFLFLNSNQILAIQNGTFDRLENLIRLDLSQNLIFDLNDGLFKQLSNLEELNLNSNKIEQIKKENFLVLHHYLHLI